MLAQPISDTPPIAITIQRISSRFGYKVRCAYVEKTKKEVQTIMERIKAEFKAIPKANFKASKTQKVSDPFCKALVFETNMVATLEDVPKPEFKKIKDSSIIQFIQNCMFDEYYTLESLSNVQSGKNNQEGVHVMIFKGPS